MTRLIIALVLALTPVTNGWTEDAPEPIKNEPAAPSPELPEHALSTKAKAAYADGRYNEASRLLFELANQFPENAAVYRSLARARSWAGEPDSSIRAYRCYLELAPDAPDREKVNAELGLLLKRVKSPPAAGLPPKVKSALADAQSFAKAGKFSGSGGAYGFLDTVKRMNHISPEVAQARRLVRSELLRQSQQALERWWSTTHSVKDEVFTELAVAWEQASEISALNAEENILAKGMDGIAHLSAGEYKAAAKILGPVAPGHQTLRYVQCLALIRANRVREARKILGGMRRTSGSPRIDLLYGLISQKRRHRKEAVEALVRALENEDEP